MQSDWARVCVFLVLCPQTRKTSLCFRMPHRVSLLTRTASVISKSGWHRSAYALQTRAAAQAARVLHGMAMPDHTFRQQFCFEEADFQLMIIGALNFRKTALCDLEGTSPDTVISSITNIVMHHITRVVLTFGCSAVAWNTQSKKRKTVAVPPSRWNFIKRSALVL